MRNTHLSVVVVAALLLAAVLFDRPQVAAQQAPMIRGWEYKTLSALNKDEWQQQMSNAGREGWEAAVFVPEIAGVEARIVLKRPLR